jgi:hypothetical protein
MGQPTTAPDEETEMPLYGGIDLHANNSVIVLLNEQDEVIYRKRLSNDLPTILEQLAPYHTEMKGLVVESAYNWYWLVDGLMELGPVADTLDDGPDRSGARHLAPGRRDTRVNELAQSRRAAV